MEMDRENLITAYLEGTASPEQVREVDRLVQSDPTFRRDLLVEGVVDSRLAAGVTWSADIFRFRQLVLRNRFFRSALCAAAAVLVLGFGLVWYIGNTKPITVVIMRSPGRVEKPVVNEAAPALAPRPETLARVTQVRGAVSIDGLASREAGTVREDSPIEVGCTLAVSSNGQVAVKYDDGTKITLYGGTKLTFDSSKGGKLLQLKTGCVDVSVVRQPEDAPMVLYTALLSVEVKGTEFRAISHRGKSWVAVKSGGVLVYRHSDSRQVLIPGGYYVADGIKNLPFVRISTQCPLWKGTCRVVVGNVYP